VHVDESGITLHGIEHGPNRIRRIFAEVNRVLHELDYGSDMLFDVQRRSTGKWEVLAVVGDVDLATFPQLVAAISALTGEWRAVDLTGVDYFDSLCTGALISAELAAQAAGSELMIVATDRTAESLRILAKNNVIKIQESLPD